MNRFKLKLKYIFELLLQFIVKVFNTIFYCVENKDNVLRITAYIKLVGSHFMHYNYGDDLNYYILSKISNKKIYNHRLLFNKSCSNVMCIGSIIEEHTTAGTIIWGAGAMYGGKHKLKHKPHKVVAVRGPLTREYLLNQGVECPEVYGDPALLLPLLYKPQNIKKKYKLGIIPHYVDFNNKLLSRFVATNKGVKLISLTDYKDWQDVVDQINECENIISSSLHGLIISDAYSVPNLWIKLSDGIAGGEFKYKDYFASVNREYQAPYVFNENTDMDSILSLILRWKTIDYNPKELIESCPFEIDKPLL